MAEDRLLDLAPGVGQVSSTWRFDVVDADGIALGAVNPARVPRIANNTTSRVMRTLSGVQLMESDAAAINPLTDYLRPVFRLEDGREWEMGVFGFEEDQRDDEPGKRTMAATMHDGGSFLNEELRHAFSVGRGGGLIDAIVRLATIAGVRHFNTGAVAAAATPGDALYARAGQDIGNPPGDLMVDVVRRLAQMAGILPPYFDRHGAFTLRPVPPLTDSSDLLRYSTEGGPGARVVAGTPKVRANLLKAPNVFVVANSGSTQDAIVGVAYVDPSLPHSRENRGREITKFVRMQGIETSAQARRMAKDLAAVNPADFTEHEFSGSFDPRHDTFDVLAYNNVPERELSWAAECAPGAPMTHLTNRAGVGVEAP